MGTATSKAIISQSINNLQISRSDLDLLNEQMSTFISKNIIDNASTCSPSSTQTAGMTIGNIVAKGKDSTVNIGDGSSQKTNITLECLQQSLQQSNINNNIATTMMTQLTNNISADTMTKLVNDAESGAKTGFLNPLAFSDSTSAVNTNVNNIQLNYMNKKLQNVIKNTVENVTKNRNASECGTKISQNLSRKIGDILALDGGAVNIQFTTSQVAESIATCQQFNSQVADVTSQVANTLGVKIDETQAQKTSTQSDAKVASKAETSGLEDLVSALFSGLIGTYALSVCAICCCVLLVCVVIYFFNKGGQTDPQSDQDPPAYTEEETMKGISTENKPPAYTEEPVISKPVGKKYKNNSLFNINTNNFNRLVDKFKLNKPE